MKKGFKILSLAVIVCLLLIIAIAIPILGDINDYIKTKTH